MQGFYFVINANARYQTPITQSTSTKSTRTFTLKYVLPMNKLVEITGISSTNPKLYTAFIVEGQRKIPILIEKTHLSYLKKIDQTKIKELNTLESNLALLDMLDSFKNLKMKSPSPVRSRSQTKTRGGGKNTKTRKMKK